MGSRYFLLGKKLEQTFKNTVFLKNDIAFTIKKFSILLLCKQPVCRQAGSNGLKNNQDEYPASLQACLSADRWARSNGSWIRGCIEKYIQRRKGSRYFSLCEQPVCRQAGSNGLLGCYFHFGFSQFGKVLRKSLLLAVDYPKITQNEFATNNQNAY